MKCEECKYWDTPDDETGPCRRHAPNMTMTMRNIEIDLVSADTAFWPWTKKDDWCGEFKAKVTTPNIKLTWRDIHRKYGVRVARVLDEYKLFDGEKLDLEGVLRLRPEDVFRVKGCGRDAMKRVELMQEKYTEKDKIG